MANRDERNYYEIQLDNKQLIFIFLIAIVICAVFFLIGVKVGKNVNELEYSLAKAEVTPENQTNLPVTEKEEKSQAVSKQEVNPSFYQLSEDKPQESGLKSEEEKKEEPEKKTEQQVTERKPEPKQKDTSKQTTESPEVVQGVRYSVQVMSTSYREKAIAMRDGLKAKNYPAFIRQVSEADGSIVYKVRVGSFSNRPQARELLNRLKQQEKITDAWIAQDSP